MEKKYDRRQQKTRTAIFNAMSTLLEQKSYSKVSVQEIIDEANIGRSTFYSHFDTKDDILKVMCEDIFGHVLSEELKEEQTHDFSNGTGELGEILEHILFHLRDERTEVLRLLNSDSKDLFMGYVKQNLVDVFSEFVEKSGYGSDDIPLLFRVNHLVSSFSEAIVWWAKNSMEYEPKVVANYYVKLI